MNTETTKTAKRQTGIVGLDDITLGGLPAVGTTLVAGNTGTGKTVFCLQVLANALARGERCVFVSLEESRPAIERGANSFHWGEQLRGCDNFRFLDARIGPGTFIGGDFDLDALQAAIGVHLADAPHASWIAIDGIDRLLRLHPDANRATELLIELDNWCRQRDISLLLTAKKQENTSSFATYLDGIEFFLDTVLEVTSTPVGNRMNRRFRIVKYRGSAHETDSVPMVLDDEGVHLPYCSTSPDLKQVASSERHSTGIDRLDTLLGGGLYQGSTLLVSGQPGTAKTTLAASIVAHALDSGRRAVFLTFDELSENIIRNLSSVNIHLEKHIESGALQLISRDSWSALVEEHYVFITRLLDRMQPDILAIDPVSALMKARSAEGPYIAAERIVSQARKRGITTVLTSLTEDTAVTESTLSHVSTLADTWISLSYAVQAGERNRSLSIVKSRGAAHSNQVRELVLSTAGVDLANVYQFGSEVLMGTARIQRESEMARKAQEDALLRRQSAARLESELAQAQQRLQQAASEAERLQQELTLQRAYFNEYDDSVTELAEQVADRRWKDRGDKPGKTE